jgi:hypothetical protein
MAIEKIKKPVFSFKGPAEKFLDSGLIHSDALKRR